MTSQEIKSLLKKRYEDKRQWIFFEECPVGTGWKGSNYIDFYVLAAWPSANNKRIAFEIKVSRQDFLNEIKNPVKRRPALFFSNEFYFIVPKGLIDIKELPIECGLMEVENGKITTKIASPFRETIRPTWNFVSALLRKKQCEVTGET